MAIVYDGQVKMAYLAIVAGYSVNGVARLHTEILKYQELKDFYEMFPNKFNNKTNGITQRRFLFYGNPLSRSVIKFGLNLLGFRYNSATSDYIWIPV
jgi:starch phosphorylase